MSTLHNMKLKCLHGDDELEIFMVGKTIVHLKINGQSVALYKEDVIQLGEYVINLLDNMEDRIS